MRKLWKQIFPTIGFYREDYYDHGTVSGTINVSLTNGVNHKMTLNGASVINIVTTGEPSGTITHVLLGITMAAAYSVTWQLNGVAQTEVSVSLNDSGYSEVLIRPPMNNWATYIADRTNY